MMEITACSCQNNSLLKVLSAMKPSALAWTLFCIAVPCLAFDPDFQAIEDLSLVEKYPTGSIITASQAQEALKDVDRASKKLDDLLKYSAQHCAENFFVNSCQEDVRKAGVRQKRRLAAIETEADKVLRRVKTQENETRLKQKESEKQSPAPRTPKAKPSYEPDSEDSAQKTLNYFDKRREETEKRQQAYEQHKEQEAANEQEYALKQQQRAQRQAQRQAQLQKREEKRAQREAKIREMDEARKNYEQTETGQ